MCSEGKCCCLKLETGTLIFGVISSVLNALSVLGSIGGLIAFNVIYYNNVYPPRERYNYGIGDTQFSVSYTESRGPAVAAAAGINVGLVLGLLKTVMDFTFSVLLCTGINQRKPSHLKAYFIYGIVMAVLASLLVLVLAIITELFVVGLMGTVAIALYGLILHMINLTRQKMTSGEVYGFEHKPLEETVY